MFALRSATRSVSVRALHTTAMRAAERSALETKLRDGLKTAMKAKDKAAVTCLKTTISDITNAAKLGADPNEPATQEAVITAIRKAVEKRNAAASEYAAGTPGANEDMFASFQNEIVLLRSYLPDAPSSEAVQAIIDEIVGGLETRGTKQTGPVMKALWERLGESRASVDKKDVAKRVADALRA